MKSISNLAEPTPEDGTKKASHPVAPGANPASRDDGDPYERELAMRLHALRCFFNTSNQPFAESARATILQRDFTPEMLIVQDALLRSSQLIHGLMDDPDAASHNTRPVEISLKQRSTEDLRSLDTSGAESSLDLLAEIVGDAWTVCKGLLVAPVVSFHTWASFGKSVGRQLESSRAAARLMRGARPHTETSLHQSLRAMVERVAPDALAGDLLLIFIGLARLLEILRYVLDSLQHDQPLKQTLPVFALVQEEARGLLELIQTRTLRIEDLDEEVFNALDGTSYAIGMELRKTFEHELSGVSSLRQAPLVYARIENAHGLLRDCFQQSTVALAQLFDPTLEGTRLFANFQTKLDQSLHLRRDLWMLLDAVRRAEKGGGRRGSTPLIERLVVFRQGSLRYLMYKDRESFERFLEEVGAATRGKTELAPVLHRFAAYLETLFGQVNMRAALAAHPFDPTAAEE